GVSTHVHQGESGSNNIIGIDMPTLKFPLVTQPMPLSLLLKFPKLRAVSLYFFEDPAYIASSADISGTLKNKEMKSKAHKELKCQGPEMLNAKKHKREKIFINPVCYRMLQRLVSIVRMDL
ncbi:hypothetical protein IWW36_004550, partial [Coemansia brasiliensis]